MNDDADFGIDLDKERQSRAAEREGKKQPAPIRFGGQVIAVLPVELPLDVLSPIREIDQDLTVMIRSAMQAARAQNSDDRWASTEIVVDMLALNPALPMTLIDVAGKIARGLLTDEGYEALIACRPTREDLAVLIKGVFRFYGVTLGEASPSSGSSEDSGQTLSGTSNTTSISTPEESGTAPTSPDSLVSAGS